MKKLAVLFFISLYVHGVTAQSVAVKLANAIKQFEADQQLRHGIISLCVTDAQTGKTLYEHYSQLGLPAASTQKLFTSVAAFELLGADYRYKTKLGYDGEIKKGVLNGNLYVTGSGDPTFGSWRWKGTGDAVILKKWVQEVKKAGITNINGRVTTNESGFSHQAIPDGWIWQDIGNYYGAGAYSINWRENQYDLYLHSGNTIGDSVHIAFSKPAPVAERNFVNELSTAAKGSGDNAYIYLGVAEERNALLRGTIPAGEKSFSISGAEADPVSDFICDLTLALMADSVNSVSACVRGRDLYDHQKINLNDIHFFATHYSPPLDSINYWFLRKSINLYGEALIKTIAREKGVLGSTEKGVELVRNFWAEHGIDKGAINIMDGSGLSPQNRVTTDAEVKVLQYAKTRPWFNVFYNALPEYNGMKMKSGSIGGSRAFAGYHTAKDGKQYIFSIIVNNYDGSAGEVVKKMYKVLDVLK
jgi:serine-type D-Ala-D-Ala carboxypeptidase/endopeptidase (penicillin-binding protein 4)